MALTSDDLVNLEFALAARRLQPELRVVLRIFDPRLAERLDRGIELDLTRSVSALAAPAFSAALLGRAAGPAARALRTSRCACWRRGSRRAGRSPASRSGDVHHGNDLRVLALDGRWLPRDDRELVPGHAISVVATREACDALLTSA